MRSLVKAFMGLIRNEIFDIPYTLDVPSESKNDFFDRLYQLSSSHDLAHIVGNALEKSTADLPEEILAKFKKSMLVAFQRYANINYEYNKICSYLEELGVEYIPLKGSVIRDLYKEGWMRTSCDIDILIKEDRLEFVIDKLVSNFSYTVKSEKRFHDVSLFSKNGVHLELHFNIKEFLDKLDEVLERVWEFATPVSEDKKKCALTNEFLLFHHIAHMSNHFIRGGCGIRPFIDLYLLRERTQYNEDKLIQLCQEAGIELFYKNAVRLCEIWFLDTEHSELTQNMEDYVLGGGMYGTLENKISIEQIQIGGKLAYIMKRIFPPYRIIKNRYTVLERHKWLLPFCWIARWFKLLFRKNKKYAIAEIKTVSRIESKRAKNMAKLMADLELSRALSK